MDTRSFLTLVVFGLSAFFLILAGCSVLGGLLAVMNSEFSLSTGLGIGVGLALPLLLAGLGLQAGARALYRRSQAPRLLTSGLATPEKTETLQGPGSLPVEAPVVPADRSTPAAAGEAAGEKSTVLIPGQRPTLRDALRLPAVSGWATTLVLLVCFLVSGLAIPMTVRLPRWVAAEVVLGVWWLVWVATLARLLYTRSVLADDIEPYKPGTPGAYYQTLGHFPSLVSGEVGCLLGALLLPVILWLLLEVALPVLAVGIFATIRGMLACVINDRHQCHGHLGRSLGWAAMWATLYTTPPALLVWWVHHLASVPAS